MITTQVTIHPPSENTSDYLNQFNRDAQELIQRKKVLHEKELQYNPLDQLKEQNMKLHDLFAGFDLIIGWDFSKKIGLINLAFDELIAKMGKGADVSYLESNRREIIELIQHIGFHRELLYQQSAETEMYLQQIEEAEKIEKVSDLRGLYY